MQMIHLNFIKFYMRGESSVKICQATYVLLCHLIDRSYCTKVDLLIEIKEIGRVEYICDSHK